MPNPNASDTGRVKNKRPAGIPPGVWIPPYAGSPGKEIAQLISNAVFLSISFGTKKRFPLPK